MQKLLVAFQATDQRVESLALAFGLGAVQRGANIRLRHLSPPEQASLAHQGYGRLKVTDIEWAECLAIGLESKDINADIEDLLIILNEAAKGSSSAGKRAFIFEEAHDGEHPSSSVVRVKSELNAGRFQIWADSDMGPKHSVESMTLLGNQLAEL